jgi:hypothetical protein
MSTTAEDRSPGQVLCTSSGTPQGPSRHHDMLSVHDQPRRSAQWDAHEQQDQARAGGSGPGIQCETGRLPPLHHPTHCS